MLNLSLYLAAPRDEISKEDDESVFPLQGSKKEREHITDLSIFRDDPEDEGKCPDLIPGEDDSVTSPVCYLSATN